MNAAGYYHCDLHPGNIMYLDKKSKTKAEMLANFKKLNPANFYIIDYGMVYHKSFIRNPIDKRMMKSIQDIYSLIWCLCDNPVADYMDHNKIQLPKYKKGLKYLEKHSIYPQLKKYLPSYVKKDMSLINDMDYLHMICMFLDYDVYCASIEATHIQEKLKLIGYQPANKAYFLKIVKNLKAPDL